MIDLNALRDRFPGMLRALAVALPAGALFDWLDTPIPWMVGPMVAVATINLMGIRVHSIPYGRQLGQVILGSAVSLYFTPPVVAVLGANIGAIVLATVAAFVIGGLGAATLSKASGVDGKSAFFSSIPGGSMAMANLAQKYGAQVPPVAVTHSLRVCLVVIVVPFSLTYGGIPLDASPYIPKLPFDLPVLIIWLAAGFAVGEISERLHLHNGYMMMPIFMGAGLTIAGIELSSVPGWMTDFAQLMFGLILGERYERAFFIKHKMFIPFAMINAVFILVASIAVALCLVWAFDLPIATMIIATAPGGLAEMAITAQALQVGVPMVIAFHLFRIVVVNMGTQFIYNAFTMLQRRFKGE
ncbi:MAG: membrane AbrB-like protein [Alphaproteobacteria bacterium]|jgi:membrane AbrB-like protein